jgi:hypothetical protein
MEQATEQMEQHPVFRKYTREWLHEITGYSKIYLSRVASGRVPLSQVFVERVSFKLNEPAEKLFLLEVAGLAPSSSSSQN